MTQLLRTNLEPPIQRTRPDDLTDEEQEDCVGDEKGAASVLVCEVGEAPDVADADGEADAREDELPLGAPVVPLRPVILVVIILAAQRRVHFVFPSHFCKL